MLFLQICIFFTFISCISCELQYGQFLYDFLRDKPAISIITLNICWSNDKIKELTWKLFSTTNPIQVNVNKNFSNTDFLKRTVNENYIVVDLSCPEARNLLEIANSTHGYRVPYKWILIETDKYINNTETDVTDIAIENDDMFEGSCREYVKDLEILVDSELTCAVQFGNKLLVWQYYNIIYIGTPKKILMHEKYGEWTEEKGFHIQYKYTVTSFRRRNLQHATIRIVFVNEDNDTYNHLDDYKYPTIDMLTKAQFGTMMGLIYYLNSTWSIVHSEAFGVKTETGLWNGLSGILQQKQADITGSGMYFFKARLEFARFLKIVNPSGIYFIFRKPPLSYEQNIYSLPFAMSVWVSIIILVIVMGISLMISSHIENPQNEDKDKVEFGNILLLVSAALCQQGCDIVPCGVPGRILTLLVFTSLMFLYVAYSANIVVLLQSTSDSIQQPEDLLKSRLGVGAHDVSYNRYYFMNSTVPLNKALYMEKMYPKGFYNLSEGIEKVRQGLFAFHVEIGSAFYTVLKTFHEHEKCECSVMEGIIGGDLGWVSCENETQYYEMFKVGLLKVEEGGIQKRFLKRFYRNTKCTHVAASFTSVGIIDFYPAILVYFCGVACAVFIFLLEHIHHKYSRKYRSRKVNFVKVKQNITFPHTAPINPY